MFSDLENFDVMLGSRHSKREESVNSNHARRPESVNSNLFENNEENLYLNPREAELGVDAELGRTSASANSSTEIIRLSSELNSRISREMDEMMNSVSVQIQRAINDAISSQVLPQIQNVLMAGSGHMTQKGWKVPAERPKKDPEVLRGENSRNNLRRERVRNHLNEESMDNVYDTAFACIFLKKIIDPEHDPNQLTPASKPSAPRTDTRCNHQAKWNVLSSFSIASSFSK